MITVKRHNAGDGRTVLALCDSELIGKKFSDGEFELDLSSSFYAGEEKSEEEVKELLKTQNIVNFVGERSVNLGVETKLISNSIKIEGIPHAQSA